MTMPDRFRWKLLAAAALIAGTDQMIKHLIRKFEPGTLIWRRRPILELMRTDNQGAAFSVLSGKTVFLLALTSLVLVCAALAVLFYRGLSRESRVCLAVMLGGGLGNWIDRAVFRSVTDYIRLLFIRFPVFNFADICITCSVIYLIMLIVLDRFESHTGEKHGTGC